MTGPGLNSLHEIMVTWPLPKHSSADMCQYFMAGVASECAKEEEAEAAQSNYISAARGPPNSGKHGSVWEHAS